MVACVRKVETSHSVSMPGLNFQKTCIVTSTLRTSHQSAVGNQHFYHFFHYFSIFNELSSDLKKKKKSPFIEVTHFATPECSDSLEATELRWQSGHPPCSQRPGMLSAALDREQSSGRSLWKAFALI